MKSAEEKKELLAYLQLELKKDPNPGKCDWNDETAAGGNYTKENPKNTGGKFTWDKKEVKTNAMRNFRQKENFYEYQTYECDEFTDGIETADKLNLPHEQVTRPLSQLEKW